MFIALISLIAIVVLCITRSKRPRRACVVLSRVRGSQSATPSESEDRKWSRNDNDDDHYSKLNTKCE